MSCPVTLVDSMRSGYDYDDDYVCMYICMYVRSIFISLVSN